MMSSIYNCSIDTYEQKLNIILNNHLALWDVIHACEREGSLDSAITNEIVNPIDELLNKYPSIHMIICNGKKSHQTTDNSWYQHSRDPYTTTVKPFKAWPYDNDPSDARNHELVWYVTNPGNNSGHIYSYTQYTINYNHS